MIKITERKRMKKVFKTGYAKDVQNRLTANGIMNQKGESFGISYITHVFNGWNSNLDIEETIIAIYQEKIEELKKNLPAQKRDFEHKKTDAGNIG